MPDKNPICASEDQLPARKKKGLALFPCFAVKHAGALIYARKHNAGAEFGAL
jgi:hypothetical protein